MSITKINGDSALVSEVTVESNVSSVEIASTLTKIGIGTYQTVTEAFRGKATDCFIVGKVVAVKKTCSLNGIQKLILREVSPEVSGNIFALFIMGKVAEHLNHFTVNIDDMLTIHQPHISKSCLNNLLSLQSYPYELQVICGDPSESKNIPSTGVFLQLIRLKVPEVVEMVPDVFGKFPGETEKTPDEMNPEDSTKAPDETDKTPEDTRKAPEEAEMVPDETDKAPEETEIAPDVTRKVPDVNEVVPRQHAKNSTQKENMLCGNGESTEVANGSGLVTLKKTRRGKRKLLNSEEYNYLNVLPKKLEKQSKPFYTKLGEITASCTKVNIIGVITTVEKGCLCMEEKEHLEIHLQDEGSSGKNFILNVGCSVSEIPPLHVNYILRAINVLVFYTNDVAMGWVTKGNLLATVDSDCEKPISLLSVEENCSLYVEDEERIYELRNFVKTSLSLGDLSIPSGDICCSLVNEDLSRDVSTTTAPVISEDEGSLVLHLDSCRESDQDEMNLSYSKVQEGFQKQRLALKQLLTFLNKLPSDLKSLGKECMGESTANKCLECGSVSLIPAGISTRRSSLRLSSRSHLCRISPYSAKKINLEVKRLRKTVKSALAFTIPETKPL